MIDKSRLDLDSNQRFVQFELWKDCHNNCSFCFNKGLIDCNKQWSLKDCLARLDNPDLLLFNEIGFIGGEFFAHQIDDVKELFYALFDKVLAMPFNRVLVTTSLIYNPQCLFEFLDYIKHKHALSRLLLCTSYDTIGRFHNSASLALWKANVLTLHDLYPQLKIHVEQIVTNDFCERVLDGRFDIQKFESTFNVRVDYLEPNTGGFYKSKEEFEQAVPNFLLRRETFIRWLHYVFSKKLVNLQDLFNRKLRSDLIYLTQGNERIEICGRHKGTKDDLLYFDKIGHVPQFGYVDSTVKLWDDVLVAKELFL
jgi:hypothetical protein